MTHHIRPDMVVRFRDPAVAVDRLMIVHHVTPDGAAQCVWPVKGGPDGTAIVPADWLVQVTHFCQTITNGTNRRRILFEERPDTEEWRIIAEDPPFDPPAPAVLPTDSARAQYDLAYDFLVKVAGIGVDPLASVSKMSPAR